MVMKLLRGNCGALMGFEAVTDTLKGKRGHQGEFGFSHLKQKVQNDPVVFVL
jgi:hypothetical protein